MFVFNWLANLVKPRKQISVLFLGLDNSGKTSLIHFLKTDKVAQQQPTMHPSVEEIMISGTNYKCYDLCSGELTPWKSWTSWASAVNAVAFVIDTTEPSRFTEAKKYLLKIMSSDEMKGKTILILGNKIDKPDAISKDELRTILDLPENDTLATKTDSKPRFELFMCSLKKKETILQAFEWLSETIYPR